MKLSQKQLQRLIENVLDEVVPMDRRRRVDQDIAQDSMTTDGQQLALDLGMQIISDKSLKVEDRVLALVGKQLSGAGVGGANVPKLDGNDLYDILGEQFLSEQLRDLQGSISNALEEYVRILTDAATDAMSEHGRENDAFYGEAN